MDFKLLILCIFGFQALMCFASPQTGFAHQMNQIERQYSKWIDQSIPSGGCTTARLLIRKEWETLSHVEKKQYIDAVQCFRTLPKKSGNRLSRSLYDDFTLAHIQKTLNIHQSGFLLPWHRYFLHLYETTLRDECHYRGALPYWDWSKYIVHLENATIFDGSPFSMSSNGKRVKHSTVTATLPGGAPPRQVIVRPPGTGGGCIDEGPFSGYNVHMDGNSTTGLGEKSISVFSRPRCITRDFYLPVLANCSSYEKVTDLILNSSNMAAFRSSVESTGCGIHAAGHTYIGGENLNLFSSPNDPIFFLHHANLDRIWAIWQSRDPEERMYAQDGTKTFLNYPPSANVTVSDFLEYGDWVKPVQVGAVMSQLAGDFCYTYG